MHEIPFNAQRLCGDTYVVPGLTNAGFIEGLVIDTGEDEAPYAVCPVDTLVITHGHADHFAVGKDLRESGASVFAPRDDASLVENPDINIRGMFSWAKPGDFLTTKLFRGEPCEVDGYVEQWEDPRASAISLTGHTMGHSGYLTRDGVLFTGDALYLDELWQRHPLPYAIDPGQVAVSLRRILDVDCAWVVPAHGHPVTREEAEGHVHNHLRQISDIEELILDRLREPHSTEQAIALVARERGLSNNPASYWLAVATVKGYLGELLGRDELEFYVEDHAGWWRTRG